MESLVAIGLLVLALAAWAEFLRVGEDVLRVSQRVCNQLQLQLLEGSVVCSRLAFRRSTEGHWQLERRYTFEFSVDGHDRRRGEVEVLSGRVRYISLEHPEGTIVENLG